MRRLIPLALILFLSTAAPALAHHEAPGAPPTHVKVIERVYPDLHAREVSRSPTRWNRLRAMAATRWRSTHSCARATLEWRYANGAATSWGTMAAVWKCDGVDPGHRAFMACIAGHEGGYGAPDVRYGGRTGDPSGNGNIVMGHLQLRPAWYRGAMAGRPGTYQLPDSWDSTLYRWAINPINQARATAPLGASQYATAGMC